LEKEGSQIVVVDEVNDYYDVNIKEGNSVAWRDKRDDILW